LNVDVRGLSVTYKSIAGDTPALDDVSLHVDAGETCAVIGPSGCGKTTLMHVLSGIITDFCGEALLNGSPVNPKRQHIGLIPQSCGLLEWADVYHNAVLGMRIARPEEKIDRQYVMSFLKRLGLGGHDLKYPGSLSGGERQRTAVARAFLMRPDLLLMDEPFSSLDAITREEMQDVFLIVWTDHPVTAVIVTHSIEEALYLGQSIAFMSPAPGRIIKTIRSPLFGQRKLRTSEQYYRSVAEMRNKAKELWSNC
jgi:NitT/TauT family transport system ATP-binding protein